MTTPVPMLSTTPVPISLFYRDGRPFDGVARYDEKGRPYTTHQRVCHRCGGAGGSEKWSHTGWTCYECGGARTLGIAEDKLYTTEQIQKLNAARDKRNAKKEAERAERAAALQAERDARRARFDEEHRDYFASVLAVCGVKSYAHEIIYTANRCCELTDKEREVLDRMVAEVRRKEASEYVGEIGERREFTCKLEKFFDWSKTDSFPKFYKYCHIMRDEQGHAIKYIGSTILGAVKWEGDRYDRYPVADESITLKFKATITEHAEYKGEKQTIVARPKVSEEAL